MPVPYVSTDQTATTTPILLPWEQDVRLLGIAAAAADLGPTRPALSLLQEEEQTEIPRRAPY
ncbi:hypothetical protein HJFPF1_12887 [Paramyrothecium foliicola]|nr:hypothetical protein HJFPF1_12887 [Paramyrothecium foliicola]